MLAWRLGKRHASITSITVILFGKIPFGSTRFNQLDSGNLDMKRPANF